MGLFETDDDSDWWNIGEGCKLLLTPLKRITPEHALMAAQIFRYDNTRVTVENGRYVVSMLTASEFPPGFSYDIVRELIAYLMGLGYDCGYASIPSLIAAGLAIEKTAP